MVFGKVWEERIDYAVGLFNGVARNTPENNDAKDLIARLILRPFTTIQPSVFGNLSLGISAASGIHQEDFSEQEYQNGLGTPFLTLGDSVRQNGRVERLGLDLAWFIGSGALKGEYLASRTAGLTGGPKIGVMNTDGFYTTLTYFLTGETNDGATVEPLHEFDPSAGDWGAIEATARYERLSVSSPQVIGGNTEQGTDVSSAAVGINWYPNDDVKVVVNYQRYFYSLSRASGTDPLEDETTLLARFQYQF